MRLIEIGNKKIGQGEPCYVIAEIGHNHQGRLDLALQMIDAAVESGVSAVKFQKRDVDSLFTRAFLKKPYQGQNSFGETYGDHRRHLELDWEDFVVCKKRAEEQGVEFLVTPFDEHSVEFCERLGVNAFKIASADLTNTPLLRIVAETRKPVLLSCGASTFSEIQQAYQLLESLKVDFVLLYSVSAYPTTPEQLNLQRLAELRDRFPQVPVGFSGHDPGIEASKYARVIGASVIEKHFTIDRTLRGTDQAFSLDKNEMTQLVYALSEIDKVMGIAYENHCSLNSYETNARMKMGKGIYVAKEVSRGTILSKDHVCFKSPGTELTPSDLSKVLGKETTVNLRPEEPIRLKELNP